MTANLSALGVKTQPVAYDVTLRRILVATFNRRYGQQLMGGLLRALTPMWRQRSGGHGACG